MLIAPQVTYLNSVVMPDEDASSSDDSSGEESDHETPGDVDET